MRLKCLVAAKAHGGNHSQHGAGGGGGRRPPPLRQSTFDVDDWNADYDDGGLRPRCDSMPSRASTASRHGAGGVGPFAKTGSSFRATSRAARRAGSGQTSSSSSKNRPLAGRSGASHHRGGGGHRQDSTKGSGGGLLQCAVGSVAVRQALFAAAFAMPHHEDRQAEAAVEAAEAAVSVAADGAALRPDQPSDADGPDRRYEVGAATRTGVEEDESPCDERSYDNDVAQDGTRDGSDPLGQKATAAAAAAAAVATAINFLSDPCEAMDTSRQPCRDEDDDDDDGDDDGIDRTADDDDGDKDDDERLRKTDGGQVRGRLSLNLPTKLDVDLAAAAAAATTTDNGSPLAGAGGGVRGKTADGGREPLPVVQITTYGNDGGGGTAEKNEDVGVDDDDDDARRRNVINNNIRNNTHPARFDDEVDD